MALTIVMMMMFDNNAAGPAENLTYRDASRIQGLEGERGGGEGEEREGKGGVREGEGRGGGYAAASSSISIIFVSPAACRDRAADHCQLVVGYQSKL